MRRYQFEMDSKIGVTGIMWLQFLDWVEYFSPENEIELLNLENIKSIDEMPKAVRKLFERFCQDSVIMGSNLKWWEIIYEMEYCIHSNYYKMHYHPSEFNYCRYIEPVEDDVLF
jgi:hypothetical protein